MTDGHIVLRTPAAVKRTPCIFGGRSRIGNAPHRQSATHTPLGMSVVAPSVRTFSNERHSISGLRMDIQRPGNRYRSWTIGVVGVAGPKRARMSQSVWGGLRLGQSVYMKSVYI